MTKGAYSSCYGAVGGENYDSSDVRFFANHPDLHWITTTGANSSRVSGIIPVGSYDDLNLYVGRINITLNNGTYQQIGKVFDGALWYYIPGTSEETSTEDSFEILACSSCANGQVNSNGPCCTNGGSGPCK